MADFRAASSTSGSGVLANARALTDSGLLKSTATYAAFSGRVPTTGGGSLFASPAADNGGIGCRVGGHPAITPATIAAHATSAIRRNHLPSLPRAAPATICRIRSIDHPLYANPTHRSTAASILGVLPI